MKIRSFKTCNMSVFSISVGNKKSIELEKCMFRVSHERVNISSKAFKLILYIPQN